MEMWAKLCLSYCFSLAPAASRLSYPLCLAMNASVVSPGCSLLRFLSEDRPSGREAGDHQKHAVAVRTIERGLRRRSQFPLPAANHHTLSKRPFQ
jgi:hypothetical protein